MKYHFFATISITELVYYPDDDNDYYEEHFLIREIVSTLKIDFPINKFTRDILMIQLIQVMCFYLNQKKIQAILY